MKQERGGTEEREEEDYTTGLCASGKASPLLSFPL